MAEDPGYFDSSFFGMTASEADGTDPQHRILLEVTYEAFENGKSTTTNVKLVYALTIISSWDINQGCCRHSNCLVSVEAS